MKTKLNRQIGKGDFLLVKGTFCEVTSSTLVNCKMIVTHSNGVSVLEPFARSEVL